ncbi:SAM-dependent methyltransferase [Aliidiomarina celeris]|uniref:SAM-dependent methyltransferase n=1 Tax=Aliidiomarina celeris TaxID=2249428 RepID=UPI000DEB5F81|nr:cyclopropane-fatty-acyl-phospholipid synthase family protein [Aliidiomarina celeris]
MPQTDTVVQANSNASLMERSARKVLFRILSHLKVGQLTIVENGEVMGVFGSANSQPQARIEVHNARTYTRFLTQGDIGAGEAFIDSDWTSSDVTQVIRLFAANLHALDSLERKVGWMSWPLRMIGHIRRRNSKRKAKENIAAHYDLGNELYTRFLDQRLQYSSAVYPAQEATLEEAQTYKLFRLCEMLELNENDQLVEIGTGWGGLAIYAAQNYGCHVTTTTISEEQYAYAKARIEALGLTDKITLLKEDYRDLTGTYDKLVSVEMIEAVGAEYLPEFFRKCSSLLKPDGRMVLQSITIADQRLKAYNRNVDFIQKHIFPGGYLPSMELLAKMYRKYTDMNIRLVDDIGLHYADTLKDWRVNFNQKLNELEAFGYDDRFSRLWNYYLCYCEGGFRERTVSAVQLMATKSQCKVSLKGCPYNA